MWALALVFIEILRFGARPYDQLENATVIWLLENEDYNMIQSLLLRGSERWSDDLRDILLDCLCPVSEGRLSAKQLSQRLNKDTLEVYKGGAEYLPIAF